MRRSSLVVLVAVLVAGCGGYVGRARRDYNEGLYLETAERLGAHESDVSELSPRRQADYGVYRGLALMMLGDLAGAQRWMTFAYEVERHTPGSLRPEERAALDRGWAELARAFATAPPPPEAPPLPPEVSGAPALR